MLRAMIRVIFALVISLSLALGVFAGAGTGRAFAAEQPVAAAEGYGPVASVPPDAGYCYPSGYNRNGWRCGWRLAQAPYNLGDYYNGYYYNGYYYGNYPWWGGTGGYPPTNTPTNGDYGGKPRFQQQYYYGYGTYYCYWYGGYQYCYWY